MYSSLIITAQRLLPTLARAAAPLLARKATILSFECACTLPVAWSTTHVALEQAWARAGHRLLIQAAAGGVGLKAVEHTQWLCAPTRITEGAARGIGC